MRAIAARYIRPGSRAAITNQLKDLRGGPFARGSSTGVEIVPDGVYASVLAAAGGHAELGEDVAEVGLDGAAREVQALCYCAVGQSVGDEREHLALAWRQYAA